MSNIRMCLFSTALNLSTLNIDSKLADKSAQDIDERDISSQTASLESIFNVLKLSAVEKRHILILDIAGAYLNARIDRPVYMYLEPALVNIIINVVPEYVKFKDSKGRILVLIDKTMHGLVIGALRQIVV